MSAIEIPTAPRRPGEGVRLFAFTVGHVHLPLAFFLEGEAGTICAPVTAFLIDHPTGLALFDTGLGPRFARPPGHPREGFIDLEDGQTMAQSLRKIGVEPEDVRWIIASHFHADHAGGNAQFPNACVIVHAAEVAHAHAMADGDLYCPAEFDTGQPLLRLDGEHDVFGDGTVVVFPTPGHTPGHQSARVQTDGGDIVLTGDCCNMKRSLDELRLPDHCHDAERSLASLRVLRGLQDKGARVFPSHDPQFWAGIAMNVPIR
ncbi:MAG TPA: N-acyl homoserine lactonase family protein [Novosphingobium sp.]|nr:N-acyl homoserine lactonase family protein [Novosphingobium sp.]